MYVYRQDSEILTPLTPSTRTALLSVSRLPVIFSPIRRRIGFSSHVTCPCHDQLQDPGTHSGLCGYREGLSCYLG